MAYDLSFSNGFFTPSEDFEDIRIVRQEDPRTVLTALMKWEIENPVDFREMILTVLGYDIEPGEPVSQTVYWELLDHIREVNTCSNLNVPVEVWIDKDGDYAVNVYD